MERIDQEGHQLPRKGQNILSASPPPLPAEHPALYKAGLEKSGKEEPMQMNTWQTGGKKKKWWHGDLGL